MFIGNNDVLVYSIGGGASDAVTPSAGPPGVGFDASIDLIVNTLMANGAKGVIANIPDVTSIPYFTTIPYNGLMLDATRAAQLSLTHAASGITFSEGSNAYVIEDVFVPGGKRKAKSTELILFPVPQDSLKCGGWGAEKPIPDKYVLTETEINKIRNAIAAFNSKIKAVADAQGLAFVDVNAFMAKVKNGIAYNGVTLSATFASGGAFSLDGVHLTPRGNALLANEFIKAINLKFGSTIPQVDVSSYNGVIFP